jgi:hypothetical protein
LPFAILPFPKKKPRIEEAAAHRQTRPSYIFSKPEAGDITLRAPQLGLTGETFDADLGATFLFNAAVGGSKNHFRNNGSSECERSASVGGSVSKLWTRKN